jgi:hypothetical protein
MRYSLLDSTTLTLCSIRDRRQAKGPDAEASGPFPSFSQLQPLVLPQPSQT